MDESDPIAPKPLYRDPVFDGAADPILVWNRQRRTWWMLATNRRANVPGLPGVSWVHGTRIGVAESDDLGATWTCRGTLDLPLGNGDDSQWAPDVVHHDGRYHMFLSVVPGMHTDWSGTRGIHHLTSPDLERWTHRSELPLSSNRVIDATVARLDDGLWRLWYKDEADRSAIHVADSPDLFVWTNRGRVVGDTPGEGPKVFRWKGRWWMVVDIWDGLRVYRSDDGLAWTPQDAPLLRGPGSGPDDQVKGGHADVVVTGDDRAYCFYFTHPGRRGPDADADTVEQRRSSIQVVELFVRDGVLACDRDAPCRIRLTPA